MIPLPGGITSILRNARLVQSMKSKRSALRRFSIARFFRNASRIEAGCFHRQRVIHDQLHRHHRVHLRRVAALLGDRIAQTGQVHQRGLAEDVVADHARREPREVQVTATFDQLREVGIQQRGLRAPHQVFRIDPRGVGQADPTRRARVRRRLRAHRSRRGCCRAGACGSGRSYGRRAWRCGGCG